MRTAAPSWLATALLIAISGLAVCFASQWWAIRQIRLELAHLQQMEQTEGPEREKELMRLREHHAAFQTEATALREKLGATGRPADERKGAGGGFRAGWEFAERILQDPATKNLVEQHELAAVQREYPDLDKELNLTREQMDRVYQVLLGRRMLKWKIEQAHLASPVRESSPEVKELAPGRLEDVLNSTQLQQLHDMLDSSQFQQFQRIEETRDARAFVREMVKSFPAETTPLEIAQRAALSDALHEELQHYVEDVKSGRVQPPKDLTSDVGLQSYMDMQERLHLGLAERVKGVLREDQSAALKYSLKQYSDGVFYRMRLNQIRRDSL